jgi:formylglycine-generating enzyme required for sulfatase activity
VTAASVGATSASATSVASTSAATSQGSTAGAGGGAAYVAQIQVTTPAGTFSIDATEVTSSAYADFLASNPSPASQPPYCSWNQTFMPAFGGMPTAGSQYPVVNVNWCDAYAYCKWAGKHLCGAFNGGPTPFYAFADATKSQWYAACSNGGATVYPYGNIYLPGACNNEDFGAHNAIPVAADSGCQGGVPGIFDMSGNVYEWEDGCETYSGASDHCRLRGGSWNDNNSQCSVATSGTARSDASSNYGFRCCSQ